MKNARAWRWGGLAAIGLLVAVFAYLNSAERVAIHLGVTILYQIPLVTLVLVAFLLGMVTMFLVSLKHDLEMRELLRQRDERPKPGAEHRPDAGPRFTPPPSVESARREESERRVLRDPHGASEPPSP